MRTRSSRALLARRPVSNRQRAVVAYGLLYRSPCEHGGAFFVDNALATVDAVDAAFRRIGITAVVGRARALVNVNAELLSATGSRSCRRRAASARLPSCQSGDRHRGSQKSRQFQETLLIHVEGE
jgi:hypothetical protein